MTFTITDNNANSVEVKAADVAKAKRIKWLKRQIRITKLKLFKIKLITYIYHSPSLMLNIAPALECRNCMCEDELKELKERSVSDD